MNLNNLNCTFKGIWNKNFKIIYSFHILLLFFLLLMTSLFIPSGVSAQKFTIDNAIQRIAKDTVLRAGQAGICVMDARTGEMLGSYNANMSLIPASNMKIVTTAAGLKILGSDFTYKTDLQYDGYIQDSVLTGNIIIKGYGDPTLGSSMLDSILSMQVVLDSIVFKIKELGINKIKGKIIGDGTAFEKNTATPTWLWEDLGNYYGAGLSGLNLNENLYELNFAQNSMAGSPPSVLGLTPHVPDFTMYNEVNSTAGGSDDAYIYTAPYSQVGIVRGTIPAGSRLFKINGAVPDPPYFAAWHLRRTLMEKGIEVTDSATTQLWLEQKKYILNPRKTFFTWQSPKLSKIVKQANLESVNLYCESILRTIALQNYGEGTNDSGTVLIKRFWQSQGINTEGLFMQDGSGLSPRNGITPFQIASMLRTISLDNQWFIPFYQSLPESGLTGTMKGMFKKYPFAIGKIRAKSGTITRVRAYSGYATTMDGRLVVFSIILNNFTCSQTEIRKRLEQFMADLVKL